MGFFRQREPGSSTRTLWVATLAILLAFGLAASLATRDSDLLGSTRAGFSCQHAHGKFQRFDRDAAVWMVPANQSTPALLPDMPLGPIQDSHDLPSRSSSHDLYKRPPPSFC